MSIGISSIASGIGSLVGGVLSAGAASKAASAQRGAAAQAQVLAQNQLNTINADFAPQIATGQSASNALASALGLATPGASAGNTGITPGSLVAPISYNDPNQIPGFQFTQTQGLQATQNAQAKMGLGQSGAAVKAASAFATGNASQYYTQQLASQLAQNQQQYNMLYNASAQGANSANMAGGLGNQALGLISQNVNAQGTAAAQGALGVATAETGAINGLTGAGQTYALAPAIEAQMQSNLNNNNMYAAAQLNKDNAASTPKAAGDQKQ